MTDDEKFLLADYWISSANWLDMFLESHFYVHERFVDNDKLGALSSFSVRSIEHLRLDFFEFISWIHHDCSILFPEIAEEEINRLQNKKVSFSQTKTLLGRLDNLPRGEYQRTDYIKVVYDILEALYLGLGWIHAYGRKLEEPTEEYIVISDKALLFQTKLFNIRKDLEGYIPEALRRHLSKALI